MMTLDTPLIEVAEYLPQRAARVLLEYDDFVQKHTLEWAREAIVYWDEMRVELDPVQFDAVMTTLVTQLAAQASAFLQVIERLSDRRPR